MEATAKDRLRAKVQWWRVPIMTAIIVIGVYFMKNPAGKDAPVSPWVWAGMALTFFGELWQLWAASHLHKDKALAASGPYKHVRNPMYFGRFFVLLGFVVMVGQSYGTIALVASVVVYYTVFALYVTARVAREEERLRGIFGEDYIHFCSEVPRFFPRLKPYSKGSDKRAQWTGIARNHEYLNMIAALVMFVAIYLWITHH
jgi:protein-S-isoprenylcysteine O-methyltransferase Ste14